MARLTVEDCLKKIDNRYDLVLLASKRARQLARSALPLFTEDKDAVRLEKPTVTALREIAAGLVTEQNIDTLAGGYSEEEDALADYEEEQTGGGELREETPAVDKTGGSDPVDEQGGVDADKG